jgi:hypothetical protein
MKTNSLVLVSLGIFLREFHCIERRVHHSHIATAPVKAMIGEFASNTIGTEMVELEKVA